MPKMYALLVSHFNDNDSNYDGLPNSFKNTNHQTFNIVISIVEKRSTHILHIFSVHCAQMAKHHFKASFFPISLCVTFKS